MTPSEVLALPDAEFLRYVGDPANAESLSRQAMNYETWKALDRRLDTLTDAILSRIDKRSSAPSGTSSRTREDGRDG